MKIFDIPHLEISGRLHENVGKIQAVFMKIFVILHWENSGRLQFYDIRTTIAVHN